MNQDVSGLGVQLPGGVVLRLPGKDPGPGVLLHRLLAALLELLEGGEQLPGLGGGGVPRAVHVDVHHPRAKALMVLTSLPCPKPDLMVDNVEACHALSEFRAQLKACIIVGELSLRKVVNKSFMQT